VQAATTGDATEMMHLALQDPAVLLGTTQQGNTCLHIASAHGHQGFCNNILVLNQTSLIKTVNAHDETPLLTAVISGQVSLASSFLRYCRVHDLRDTIMKQDKHGCNVLHHAIRSGVSGHRMLALDLIDAEPALSKAVNKYDESPMFIAVMRDFTDIFEKLLKISDSAHGGTSGYNALHAAVRNGNQGETYTIIKICFCLFQVFHLKILFCV
jgi:ankyrin repeat protein